MPPKSRIHTQLQVGYKLAVSSVFLLTRAPITNNSLVLVLRPSIRSLDGFKFSTLRFNSWPSFPFFMYSLYYLHDVNTVIFFQLPTESEVKSLRPFVTSILTLESAESRFQRQ